MNVTNLIDDGKPGLLVFCASCTPGIWLLDNEARQMVKNSDITHGTLTRTASGRRIVHFALRCLLP